MKTKIPSNIFKTLALYIRSVLLITIAAAMWVLAYNIHDIKKEINNVYTLHINQAKQIDVLLNLRLREVREKEQEWLRETREKYDKINNQDDNEKILEKSPE
tara:strand:- start:199 stop:504 length:306 start_codon:yes stop_codon:yes gene_type:complete